MVFLAMEQNYFFELFEDLVLPHLYLVEAFDLQKEEENDRRYGRNLRNFKEATFVQKPLLSVFLDGINSVNGGSRDFVGEDICNYRQHVIYYCIWSIMGFIGD